MAQADFYTVTASFVGTLGGHEVEYHAGEVVSANDPAVKKMPLHFSPLVVREHEDHRTRAVEQATAAPGERRTISIRRGKKPAAKAQPAPEPEPTPEPTPEPETAEPVGKAITTAGFKGG